jgi:hypothetical protein
VAFGRRARLRAPAFVNAHRNGTLDVRRKGTPVKGLEDDPIGDIARAEDWAGRAVVAQPGNSAPHWAKAFVFVAKRQWPQSIAEAEAAIAANPNNADAHALHSVSKMYLGHSEEGFSGLEPTAAARTSSSDRRSGNCLSPISQKHQTNQCLTVA